MNPTPNTPLYPTDRALLTAEGLITKLSGKSSLLYGILLSLFCIGVPTILMMKVDIVIRVTGILKSSLPNHLITSISTGQIQKLYIKEYQYVQKGDTLLCISDPGLQGTLHAAVARKEELRLLLDDLYGLKDLCAEDSTAPLLFKTALYSRAYARYEAKRKELHRQYQEQNRQWIRLQYLFIENAIAKAEYEAAEYALDQSQAAYTGHYQAQMQAWHTEQMDFEKELLEIEAHVIDLQTKKDYLAIIAPVSGSIFRSAGLEKGGMVYSGQELLEISPDTLLRAECLLSPAQAGFVYPGQTVKIASDAYPHTQWGMISGTVCQISPDIYMTTTHDPYFKLFCNLDAYILFNQRNHYVSLKKGMSVQVRIIHSRQPIFRLLYQKMDQWINPNMMSS